MEIHPKQPNLQKHEKLLLGKKKKKKVLEKKVIEGKITQEDGRDPHLYKT